MPNLLFGWDTPTEKTIGSFSDPSIDRYFHGSEAPEIKPDTVDALLAATIALRGQGRSEQAKSACTYLLFAQGAVRPAKLGKAECYHRAANDLRGVDALDKSAQCYYSAAATAFLDIPDAYPDDANARKLIQDSMSFALRSAGRAKAQYQAIGMDDEADDAHRLQQEITRRRYHLDGNPLRFILSIWRGVTGYGTSVRQWLTCLMLSLLAFSAIYWALIAFSGVALANQAPFAPPLTPIYLAFMNLMAFGTYTQIVPLSGLGEIVLIAQALVSFVLVGTGATFLSRR